MANVSEIKKTFDEFNEAKKASDEAYETWESSDFADELENAVDNANERYCKAHTAMIKALGSLGIDNDTAKRMIAVKLEQMEKLFAMIA